MKRITIVMILLVLMATSAGCRRGGRMWGLRGGPCAPEYPPPPPVAVTTSAPTTVYSPVTTSAPAEVYPAPVPTIESIPQTVPSTTTVIPQ